MTNSSYTTPVVTTPVIDLSSESSSDESIKFVGSLEPISKEPELIPIDSDSSLSSDCKSSRHARRKEDGKKRKKKRRERSDSRKRKSKYETEVPNVYFEDTTRDRRNLSVSTLGGSARPRYNRKDAYVGFKLMKKSKKQPTPRYFAMNIDSVRKGERRDTRIKRTKEVEEPETLDLDFGVNLEQEQTNRTREFNERLAEDPEDVETWMKYIKFQVITNPSTIFRHYFQRQCLSFRRI